MKFKMEEKIEVVITLSKKQKEEIYQLLEDCKRKDFTELDFFMEQEWNELLDCPCFFLFYREKQLLCAVSAFIVKREAEISAVTRFEDRRKGLFSKVMKETLQVLTKHGIKKVSFRIEDDNDKAKQILEHWKYSKIQMDCFMILLPKKGEKENKEEVRCFTPFEIKEKKQELVEIHCSAFGGTNMESEWIFEENFSEGIELWGYWIENQVIGLCFVSTIEQGYYLSAISICKREQGKGYGKRFLKELLRQLWKQEKKTVFLQVSGENTVAMNLYEKLGFSVKQRLLTYQMIFK